MTISLGEKGSPILHVKPWDTQRLLIGPRQQLARSNWEQEAELANYFFTWFLTGDGKEFNQSNVQALEWKGISTPTIKWMAFPEYSFLFQGRHIAPASKSSASNFFMEQSLHWPFCSRKPSLLLSVQGCLQLPSVDFDIGLQLAGLFYKKSISGGKIRTLEIGTICSM